MMNSHAIHQHVLQSRSLGELTERIASEHGLFVPITEAWQAMGFRTYGAARRAAANGRLGIPAVFLPGRRTRFPQLSSLVCHKHQEILAAVVRFEPPSTITLGLLMRQCVRQHGYLPRYIYTDCGSDYRSKQFTIAMAELGVSNASPAGEGEGWQ